MLAKDYLACITENIIFVVLKKYLTNFLSFAKLITALCYTEKKIIQTMNNTLTLK